MSGWRDTDGRTASERRKLRSATDRAQFAETLRRRPITFVKGLLGFAFILVLVFALIGLLR